MVQTEFVDHEVMEDDTGSLTETTKHTHGHEEGSQPLTPPGERFEGLKDKNDLFI